MNNYSTAPSALNKVIAFIKNNQYTIKTNILNEEAGVLGFYRRFFCFRTFFAIRPSEVLSDKRENAKAFVSALIRNLGNSRCYT